MLLIQSYLYKGRKIFLRIDKITNRGYVYIDSKLINIMNTNQIELLRSEAEDRVDIELYGTILNISA